eukprot:Skav211684  [mRNA]  locus=scaffold216:436631:438553:- [translate_table: standard]
MKSVATLASGLKGYSGLPENMALLVFILVRYFLTLSLGCAFLGPGIQRFSLALASLFLLAVWIACFWIPIWWANFLAVLINLIMVLLFLRLTSLSAVERTFWVHNNSCLDLVIVISICGIILWQLCSIGIELHQRDMWDRWKPQLLQPVQEFVEASNLTQKELNPYTWLYGNFTGVPAECRRILEEDIVNNTSEGTKCVAWCRTVNLFLPLWPVVFASFCFKAETSVAFTATIWGFNTLPLLLAVLYSSRSIFAIIGGIFHPRDVLDVSPQDEVTVLGPSGSSFDPKGPFHSPGWMDPLECAVSVVARNDLEAATYMAWIALSFNVAEPFLDLYSVSFLLAHGQPFYGTAMLASVFIPNWADPFQIGFAEELEKSTHEGMVSREVLQHQRREGIVEGSISALIVLCALVRTPTMPSLNIFLLCSNVLLSLVIGIPTGCKANELLQMEVNLDNYYDTAHAKKQLNLSHKYLLSAVVLSLGCMLGTALCVDAVFSEEAAKGKDVAFKDPRSLIQQWNHVVALSTAFISPFEYLQFVARWEKSIWDVYFRVTRLILGPCFWVPFWIDVAQRQQGFESEWQVRQLLGGICGTLAAAVALALPRPVQTENPNSSDGNLEATEETDSLKPSSDSEASHMPQLLRQV